MPTIGTSPAYSYTEVDKSVARSGQDDFDFTPATLQLAHTKVIDCAWADRYSIVNLLKNTNTLCPVSNLYALLFHIEPIGKPTGTENTWPKARIEIGYKSLPFDAFTGNKEETYEAGLYTPDIPTDKSDGAAGWQFTLNDATRPPTITYGVILYTVTLHNQTSFDRTTADGLLNKVNSGTFNGWAAGHVLFEGYTSASKNIAGSDNFDISYRFKWLQISWQDEFNPDAGAWEEIVDEAANNKYDGGDFGTLSL